MLADGALAKTVIRVQSVIPAKADEVVMLNDFGDTVKALTNGVELDDGLATAVSARVTAESAGRSTIEIVMREGRNREVRRMCDAIGHPVSQLVRTAIGPLRDRTLKPGSWRHLTIEEVRSLYEAGGASWQDAGDG